MKTILLVEDEVLLAYAGEAKLKRYGYEVRLACNGQAAIDAVRTEPHISLVLMDIDLNDEMTGIEAAQTILAIKRLPILFFTSHQEPNYVEAARTVTNYGYILKQSGEFVLIEAIRMAYELFEASQQLAAQEALFRLVLEHVSDGILLFEDHRIRYASPSYSELFGYENTEDIGRGIEEITELIHPEDRHILSEILDGIAKKQTRMTSTYRARSKSGRYIWREDTARFLYNEHESVKAFVVCRDVSEREDNLRAHVSRIHDDTTSNDALAADFEKGAE